jgi:uncharacterized protein YfaP (DUF2135 family)
MFDSVYFANKNGTTLQNLQFCINIFILTKSDATMEIEFSWDEHKAEINLKSMV